MAYNNPMTELDNKRLHRIVTSNWLLTIVKLSKREHGQASIPGISLISDSEQFTGMIGFITNSFIVLPPSDNVTRSTVCHLFIDIAGELSILVITKALDVVISLEKLF